LSGLELFLQIVGPEIIPIGSVPLLALSLVPLSLAGRITTAHLTILHSAIGQKPSSTDAAWTLLGFMNPWHRFLSLMIHEKTTPG